MNAIKVGDVLEVSQLGTESKVLKFSESVLLSHDVSAALDELSTRVGIDPSAAPQSCVAAALQLCQAATAGLSVLRFDGAGRAVFQWVTVRGVLAAQQGVTTLREASTCGLCLDAGTTVLISTPERMFAYLQDVQPAIIEKMIVPLYDSAHKPLGTLWVAQHDSVSRFGSRDARVMEQLALLLAPALQYLATTEERQAATLLLVSYKEAQQAITHELFEERGRRERAEAAESEIRKISDAGIQDAHHRTKNTLQMASNLLRLQSHASHSAEIRTALEEGHLRLSLLARVHELLYKSPDDSGDIFMPKLLRTLGEALRNAFPDIATRVSLEVGVDPILLVADQAISLGLLANEVLTNAYKHAFPAGASGTITLDLRCAPAHPLILQITDNGIGLRSSNEVGGLGLTLIRAFAAQLHGTLVIGPPVDGAGTQITLTMTAPRSSDPESPAADRSLR